VWYITTRSLVASIQLAHWATDDQGFLIMDIIYALDNEVMFDMMDIHPTLVLQ
jgi:hypothetical protein